MDLPPPVQDPEPRTPEFRTTEPRVTVAEDSLARRLDIVEARLVALGARLEQMEASLHQVVRDECHTVSTEIRYTLSELGRRLALDLPQTLDRHRQMIVAELRPAGQAAGETAVAATTKPDAPIADAAAGETKPPVTVRSVAGDRSVTGDGSVTDDGSATGADENDGHDESDIAEAGGDASSESSNAGGRRKRRRRRGEG